MKRINLSIDIEDNQLFEENVKKALLGQARQIAREELEKELKSEIERITDAKVEEIKTSSYWSAITTRITDSLIKRLDKEITLNSKEMSVLFEQKVNEYLDKKFSNEANLDEMIQAYMDKSVASLLITKANQ